MSAEKKQTTKSKATANNYVNRRKSFHFSKKNDDLLKHLNEQEMDQTAYIMSLIRKDKEEKEARSSGQTNSPEFLELKNRLDEALHEIKTLKEELPNMTAKVEVETNSSATDNDTMSFILQMLSEIKKDTDSLKDMVKNAGLHSAETEVEALKPELSEDDFLDLALAIDFDDANGSFSSGGFGFNN